MEDKVMDCDNNNEEVQQQQQHHSMITRGRKLFALSQHMKRSSSAPMINQIERLPPSPPPHPHNHHHHHHHPPTSSDTSNDAEVSNFLSSAARPRRFSASFSPGPPSSARVIQLRAEGSTDWETHSEKEFHGTQGIAASWEDLSLEGMSSMDIGSRRTSISDQLWLSLPPSAPSSPLASPRVLRFSPLASPTRRSFTRRSISPITVRPSVLQSLKRKGSGDMDMDCSPAKRPGLLWSGGLGGSREGSPYTPEQTGSPNSHPPSSSSSSLLQLQPTSSSSSCPSTSSSSGPMSEDEFKHSLSP